ncbi:protein kinase domain-containing protein [Larkinella humicola]|uniref:Protein kinase n=1 Tax=Larkinella humicola TaxID=2607654 RepID=A0A5N1JMB0_9BACT|nr:protein kinase [Larkinella humicola]KAA9357281.1 protein kinase [Larkinella humicola]
MNYFDLTPEFISKYKISSYKNANHGGQKKVFIVNVGTEVFALKVVENADERLDRELEIYKKYNTSYGIPKIKEIDKFGKNLIIFEEYIEGNDLSDISSTFNNNEEKIIKLIKEIVLILDPIWTANFVHRDLKPQNIRIKPNGDPVVLDFGIARDLNSDSITATGGQPLSYLYATPEQYQGKKNLISYRTDFFNLGLIAYYLYTNSLPFGNNKIEIDKIYQKPIPLVKLDSSIIERFCNAVLKNNPSERPRNVEIVLNLLIR